MVVCLVLFGCIDPADRRPGLWLSGEVSTDDVVDWSSSVAHPEIFIETRTPYLIPHSTTIACASHGGMLYVAARDPLDKRWVRNVERDPEVRLEIDDRIYERRLLRVDDPVEQRAIYRAYATKYGWPESPPPDAPEGSLRAVTAVGWTGPGQAEANSIVALPEDVVDGRLRSPSQRSGPGARAIRGNLGRLPNVTTTTAPAHCHQAIPRQRRRFAHGELIEPVECHFARIGPGGP
jgi:hypothetical protein